MKANVINLPNSTPIFENHLSTEEFSDSSSETLIELLCQEMQAQVKAAPRCVEALANRIAVEVERICDKSSRIQTSGKSNPGRLRWEGIGCKSAYVTTN